MAEMTGFFEFKECVSISKATGRSARTLRELRDIIAVVSRESIFHHTYQYFLNGHMLEYTNDFANWAGESLEERALAEQLSSIDPYDFTSVDDLRQAIVKVIDDYSARFPEPRAAIQGEEFHFIETVTFIFPMGIRVKNLAEFLTALRFVDAGSLYYHFYEARMRLGGGVDDFSRWIEDLFDKQGLVQAIRAIDPFMHSVGGIREHLIEAVEEEVRRDMEGIDRCLMPT